MKTNTNELEDSMKNKIVDAGYGALLNRYTAKFINANMKNIADHNPNAICELLRFHKTCNSLKETINTLENLKNREIGEFLKLCEVFKDSPYCIMNKNGEYSEAFVDYLKWVPTNITLKLMKICKTWGCTNFSKLNEYICVYNRGAEFESIVELYNVIQDGTILDSYVIIAEALNNNNRYVPINDRIKLDNMPCIESIRGARYSVQHEMVKLFKSDPEFMEFCRTIDDLRYLTYFKVPYFYKVYQIDKRFCDEFLKLSKYKVSEPLLFVELLELYTDNLTDEELAKGIRSLLSLAQSNNGINAKFVKYFNENDPVGYANHLLQENCDAVAAKKCIYSKWDNIRQYAVLTDYSFMKGRSINTMVLLTAFKNSVWSLLLDAREKEKDTIKYNKELDKEVYERKLLNGAEKRINEYINSNIDFPATFYEMKKYSEDYSDDVKLIQKYNVSLYNEYFNKIESRRKSIYATMETTASKYRNAIENSRYTLSLFDFCKIYNPRDIHDYFNNSVPGLSYNNKRVLTNWYKKNKLKFTPIKTQFALDEKIICNGTEITTEMKERIFAYIKLNKLPWCTGIYNELCRKVANDQIDLNMPF